MTNSHAPLSASAASDRIQLPRSYLPMPSTLPYMRCPPLSKNSHSTRDTSKVDSQQTVQPSVSSWRASRFPPDFVGQAKASTAEVVSSSGKCLPFTAKTRQGSDFIVYHTCQHCDHPRSIRYHRDHPVTSSRPSLDGVCGRCRRASATRGLEPTNQTTEDVRSAQQATTLSSSRYASQAPRTSSFSLTRGPALSLKTSLPSNTHDCLSRLDGDQSESRTDTSVSCTRVMPHLSGQDFVYSAAPLSARGSLQPTVSSSTSAERSRQEDTSRSGMTRKHTRRHIDGESANEKADLDRAAVLLQLNPKAFTHVSAAEARQDRLLDLSSTEQGASRSSPCEDDIIVSTSFRRSAARSHDARASSRPGPRSHVNQWLQNAELSRPLVTLDDDCSVASTKSLCDTARYLQRPIAVSQRERDWSVPHESTSSCASSLVALDLPTGQYKIVERETMLQAIEHEDRTRVVRDRSIWRKSRAHHDEDEVVRCEEGVHSAFPYRHEHDHDHDQDPVPILQTIPSEHKGLRGILRNSALRREQRRSGKGQHQADRSLVAHVTFSHAVDVMTFSPNMSTEHLDPMSSFDLDEIYHFQAARRGREAERVTYRDITQDACNLRLVKALSESPSREAGLRMSPLRSRETQHGQHVQSGRATSQSESSSMSGSRSEISGRLRMSARHGYRGRSHVSTLRHDRHQAREGGHRHDGDVARSRGGIIVDQDGVERGVTILAEGRDDYGRYVDVIERNY